MKPQLFPKRKINPLDAPYGQSGIFYMDVAENKFNQTSVSNDLTAHAALIATHGITGAIVGTSETQTLSNKTMASFSISSGGTVSGVGTGANGILLKNLKNGTASALSGTQRDITIDIGGTSYYFTVYPTKA